MADNQRGQDSRDQNHEQNDIASNEKTGDLGRNRQNEESLNTASAPQPGLAKVGNTGSESSSDNTGNRSSNS
jgi:hypothetical protein